MSWMLREEVRLPITALEPWKNQNRNNNGGGRERRINNEDDEAPLEAGPHMNKQSILKRKQSAADMVILGIFWIHCYKHVTQLVVT
jgi:hypothetical protein